MLPVRVVDVGVRDTTLESGSVNRECCVILLQDESNRALVIWLGELEMQAIVLQLTGIPFPRPLTYILFCELVVASQAKLERVEINGLSDGTYFANLMINAQGKTTIIDARPSDAIVIAIALQSAIYVDKQTMEVQGFTVPVQSVPTGIGIQNYSESLQEALDAQQRKKMYQDIQISEQEIAASSKRDAQWVISRLFVKRDY